MRWITKNLDLHGDILHFGEGNAIHDTIALEKFGNVRVFEPNPRPHQSEKSLWPEGEYFDFAIGIYVLNVIPQPNRSRLIRDLRRVSEKIIVAVRTDNIIGTKSGDGVITARGTFQKSYDDWALVNLGRVLHKGSGFAILDM